MFYQRVTMPTHFSQKGEITKGEFKIDLNFFKNVQLKT